MLFSTPIFFFYFLPLLLALYALIPSLNARNTLLLVASIGFYTWGEMGRVWVLGGVVLASHYGAVCMSRTPDRRRQLGWLTAFIALDISFLVYFKYARFFAEVFDTVTGINLAAEHWANPGLPLGISFFTFQGISYLVDVYRGHTQRARSLKEFALYITLFPHLIAGPIVRFKQIRARLARRSFGWHTVNRGLVIFTFGLASKVLIANPLGALADPLFTTPIQNLSVSQAWLGGLLFTFQIYFDFQGYSLMAIGLAAIFGIKFPVNFNNPYQAHGIADFWRRWHISLSSWMRDYIFRPLAKHSVNRIKIAWAISMTFLFSGIWHGANWNFLIWGMLHGLLRIAELYKPYRRLVELPVIGQAWTFLLVLVGWVIFRIEDLSQLERYLKLMFFGHKFPAGPLMTAYPQILTPDIILTLLVATALAFLPRVSGYANQLIFGAPHRMQVQRSIIVIGLLVISLAYLSAQTFSPFIYFRF